jgi:hypothetical protein
MLLPIFHRPNSLSVTMDTAAGKYCLGRRLLGTASLTLLLGYSASAQNAPSPASIPTGDQVLYGRHAGLSKKNQASQFARGNYPSAHELRLKRYQYVAQHREEFPATYQPGVE